jgi:preprotein translocase subunit SecA
MDHLKEGIGLRGYAQQDPLVAYKKESFEMFEAMMLRFQEDTVRHLFRMQIIGPDGNPIESLDQLPPDFRNPEEAAAAALQQPPIELAAPTPQVPPAHTPPVPIPTRTPSTTIDDLEREFQRKKQRELDLAHAAGAASAASNGTAPRVTGDKVGRNDPCPCGSGKKFKKCHGADA